MICRARLFQKLILEYLIYLIIVNVCLYIRGHAIYRRQSTYLHCKYALGQKKCSIIIMSYNRHNQNGILNKYKI